MAGDVAELLRHVEATRTVIKAAQRTNRTALAFLADLQERLEALENAQPGRHSENGIRHKSAAGA